MSLAIVALRIAATISSADISIVFGIPVIRSLPLTAIDFPEVLTADPTVHLIDSDVLSPIDNL